MSTHLSGRAAAPGAAIAPAFVVRPRPSAPPQPTGRGDTSAGEEKERLAAALEQAENELHALAEKVAASAGQSEAEIFEAHAEFAADPEIADLAGERIDGGASAEEGVSAAFDEFRALLAASSSEYMQARAADLDDVRDRVVTILRGESTTTDVPETRAVVVAEELTPSQTASFPRELIAAIITASGSPTSHAAILSRALGIPAVVAVEGLMKAVEDAGDGVDLAVDGGEGTVVVGPDDDEREVFAKRQREEATLREHLAALRDEKGMTSDGTRVELAANLGGPDDLPPAREVGAEGSGLVRTEFLFLGRQTPPTLDEQAEVYREMVTAFPGHRVVLRTMDIGADKPLPFVDRAPEENPALGVRGIRLSLTDEDIFRPQLQALLRVHAETKDTDAGRMAIMFPLVSGPAEFRQARSMLDHIAEQDGIDTSGLEVGVMIEVPSAALAIRRIAPLVDFVSIGTNDLLQYTFAVDRLVGDVAGLADVCDPDVLRLLREVVQVVHDAGKWVGVCGEAASDRVAAAALVGFGVDELSMSPVAIPEIKHLLRQRTRDELATAAEAALGADDADDARERISSELPARL